MGKAEFTVFFNEVLKNAINDIDFRSLFKDKIELPKDEYSTVSEAAEYFKISRQTVYNWEKKGLVTLYKIGRRSLCKIPEIQEKVNQLSYMFGRNMD